MGEQEEHDNLGDRHHEGPPILLEGRVTGLEARQREQQVQDKKYKSRQLLFNFLLVLVGAGTIGVYAYQACIMNQSLKAAKISADAAKSAANTAADTLDRSVEQFRIDERAWIEIERIEPTIVSERSGNFGAAFRYRLFPKNAGKTAAHGIMVSAARNMQASIALESNADGMKRTQDTILLSGLPKVARENPVPRVLAPGAIAAVPFVMDGQEPQIFPKDEWVSYLIGRIDYTDDFGVNHWMKFCFYVGERNGALWNCHEGNDEDSNPEILPNSSAPKKK